MMEIKLKLTFLENLFLCLCLLTVLGQENVSTVVTVTEGSDAVLPCSIRPEQNIERDHFEWKKDRQMVFLYKNGLHSNNGLPGQDEQFRGRVSHFPDQLQFSDASIRIRDTKESDSGNYSCDFSPDEPNRQAFTIVVFVLKDRWEKNIRGASLKPHITALDHTRVKAQLQCEVLGVSPKPKVEWQDSSGNILPAEEPQVTERGGSYDIILQTTVNKTDNYSCVVTQEKINHQVFAVTSVYIHGAVTELCVTILDHTDAGVLLQCVVRGASPKPTVEWQDSSGNTIPAKEPQVTERGGSYDIILQTSVTKTDRYQCFVKQEEIKAEIYVHIRDPEPPEGAYTGWIVGVSFLCILLVVIVVALAVLYKKHYITINYQKSSETERKGDEQKNPSESVKLNVNPDTNGV